ncbi:VOC family protein [Amycolatopsis sp. NPDC051903]|uniref:VOC family protein n=1 Tax=Amycolatopsis sp. NPDC051903 TaxID=3363936 RepID=UPI0037B56FDC
MTAGLHHLGVRVAALEKAVAFYRELGAEPLAGEFTLAPGAARLAMNARGAGPVRVALLGFPDGSGVELFEFGDPVPPWCAEPEPAARLPHLGIQVPDVDAALARAEAAGGQRLWDEPQQWGPVRVVYLRDPDGTVLELLDGPLRAVADVVAR